MEYVDVSRLNTKADSASSFNEADRASRLYQICVKWKCKMEVQDSQLNTKDRIPFKAGHPSIRFSWTLPSQAQCDAITRKCECLT